MLDRLKKGEEIGFPSEHWFSDHLPVGVVVGFIE